MPNYLVVRIVPLTPVDARTFQDDYLNGLTITAYQLDFETAGNQPAGAAIGHVTFDPFPATFWTADNSTPPNYTSGTQPTYPTPTAPAPTTTGLIQQTDALLGFSNIYALQSVATAVIEVNTVQPLANIQLSLQWGQAQPTFGSYYDLALSTAAGQDLNTWAPAPTASAPVIPYPWANPPPSPNIYISIGPAPGATPLPTLQLPTDGSPPAFQDLLAAVQSVLKVDPGAPVTVGTSPGSNATAATTSLQFPAGTEGISTGMSVSGAGVPSGTIVVAIDGTGLVTLSQQLSANVGPLAPITFTADLGALSLAQCKNIAYEIVWSQQPSLPTPPSAGPLEDLYTEPTTSGTLLTGSSNTTPNPYEGDRQQFEAQLKSYYTVANATADRLTNFVFSLSAAIASQQQSLAATQVLLSFPANPGAANSGSANDIEVILTGLGPAGTATNFGVPAPFFYALAATMPPQVTAQQRYKLATGEPLGRLLADLTSAINAGTVTDSNVFTPPLLNGAAPAPGSISAAQAARQLAALAVPAGTSTALAPLDSIALVTVGDAPSGSTLAFASVAGVNAGMSVAGPNIAPGTTVSAPPAANVPLSAPLLNDVPPGTSIVFTQPYPAGLQPLIQAWLAFPSIPSGAISSATYQPGDDDTKFWPGAIGTQPAAGAFLNLVLCALTQGAMLPAPFTGALGDAITSQLLPSATVTALAAVTAQQWTNFFTANPAWLPSFTQPGNTAARIDAFIREVQNFFGAGSGVPLSSFILATSAATPAAPSPQNLVLQFPPTTAVLPGMSVSGQGVATGSLVAATPGSVTTTVTETSVTLTETVLGPGGVAKLTNITFSLTLAGSATGVTNQFNTNALSTTNILQFPSTNKIVAGMSVTGNGVPGGTIVGPADVTTSGGNTFVTLSNIVGSPGVANNEPITFGLISAPPAFQGLAKDWFGNCLAAYGAFTIGNGFALPQLQAAAATVFPGDRAAQAWIVDALVTLDALYQIMKPVGVPPSVPTTNAAAYTFSVVEALYARGFTSAARITELSGAGFQRALAGTVAYDLASSIYGSASAIAPPAKAPPAPTEGFKPVNPDGALTNCIPPRCSSPLGPVAYLSELLKLSENSTCDTEAAPPLTLVTSVETSQGETLTFVSTTGVISGMLATGTNIPAGTTVSSETPTSVTLNQPISAGIPSGTAITFTAPTLGSVLGQRRGPIGNLAASCPNLATPLPLIDIVNECLEYMASQATPSSGTIYDTSADRLAGYEICQEGPCPADAKPGCHDPARLFAALPEYSTPAVPVAANSAVEPAAWNNLKSDFSSCRLPYSQPIDVSRTYLRHFGSCRFEVMRTFRKCITEFVLDPNNEPAGFADYLWRYPVRIDIAREYLGITPEEYALFFDGAEAPPCDGQVKPAPAWALVVGNKPWLLYGFNSPGVNDEWITTVSKLPEFLARTCLSYCEFFELVQALSLSNDQRDKLKLTQCEPCCLDTFSLPFSGQELVQLAILIRLWRKLRDSCCLCCSFAELLDISNVLQLFIGASPNPEFIRHLAAFQMLREQFLLDLVDPADKPAPTAAGADRTHILALWVGPAAKKWGWAVRELCNKIVLFTRRRSPCEHRSADFGAVLASHLDSVSKLAGFDPTSTTDNWHALSPHTLRFAEILTKITRSRFDIGDLVYLFTSDDDPDGGKLFPLQTEAEALELPLGLPDDEAGFSLWHLRRELLAAADEAHGEDWDWRRVASVLQEELGFAASDVTALAQHVFPHVLERAGDKVNPAGMRFVSSLPAAQTTPKQWTGGGEWPFQYDEPAGQLWVRIPFTDREVITQLASLDLKADDQIAVQDLYFQPRAMLALFAVLFPDFPEAQRHLIEEPESDGRWHYFRRHVALCHRRCHIIATHLSRHVAAATKQECPEDHGTALLILRELVGDENKATADWENDAGTPPPVTWTPKPNGSAFAALLGLLGTGLVAEYKLSGGTLVWREVSGALNGFGTVRNRDNVPVPTVLPSLGAVLPPQQAAFLKIRNGLLLRLDNDEPLGGAQGFDVTWSGVLLVEEEGAYEFWAGSPTPECEIPNWDAVETFKWRVVLKRGARSWVILSHQWPSEEERLAGSRLLKRGAYKLTAEVVRPDPEFAAPNQLRRVHAGFEIKYAGPDTCGERIAIPRHRLFSIKKDQPLGAGIVAQSSGATSFLSQLYPGSLRDIRRTYQRAFKSLLFARRLGLAERPGAEDASELSFMLRNAANFAGASYYRAGGVFTRHLANFDFNFLPIADNYQKPASDARSQPSQQRSQAMFDWCERLFDYTGARDDIRQRYDREFWHLFRDALRTKPTNSAPLLGELGIDPKCRPLGVRYYVAPSSPIYDLPGTDLEDDRWGVRVWHAERWVSALECRFTVKDVTAARPDLWASDDPSSLVKGETVAGNANLSSFISDGCLENGEPQRYEDLRRLNEGLRVRGRDALVAYLCRNRVPSWPPGQFVTTPRELTDLLLLDVDVGVCERASRIEEAISAAQTFIRRARLHLEPAWAVTPAFARLWDREFATFHTWQACKRRQLYKENWIEWSDLRHAQGVEAFRTLQTKLGQSAIAVAMPGGGNWWPDGRPATRRDTAFLQAREPVRMEQLPAEREGLNLLGTPDNAAQPSWLAIVPSGAAGGSAASGLPEWLASAIRLGTRFWRIAAAGTPPGAAGFASHAHPSAEDCVSCCGDCGCDHTPHTDEYYFWLIPGAVYTPPTTPAPAGFTSAGDYENGFQDDFYDPVQQTSTVWQDPTQLPQLLAWPSVPTVRLAWCRVHDGQFGQPRRSHFGVRIDPSSSSDLTFLGRQADSLTFAVSNGISPQGYADTSTPGFRYDIAADNAVVLPLVLAPATPPTFLNTLPAYPYFLFLDPGMTLFPLSPFSPSLTIAAALRANCRFEAALAWYRQAFNPLRQDCTWIDCNQQAAPAPAPRTSVQNACCDATEVSCDQTRTRAIILHYLETLVEWSDALRHRANSVEMFQQADALLDVAEMILARPPRSVRLQAPSAPPTLAAFTPAFAALNPRLLDLYEILADRLELIRNCQSARRLADPRIVSEASYFGNDPSREGWRDLADCCAKEDDWCHLHSPYRFSILIQKAQDYAARVQEFGGAFLAAIEKGDGELLASLRASQEREVLSLGLAAQQDQWRDADWSIEALQKTKAMSQTNLNYYQSLINGFPIGQEVAYQDLTILSTVMRGASQAIEAVSGSMNATGNFFLGTAGFGGSPLIYEQLPIGGPLGDDFAADARILSSVADAAGSTAGLDLTEAGWTRRQQEWTNQVAVLRIEIQQIERQILAAQRRRGKARQDLDIHRRQMENSAEVQNFLRDRFSAPELYLFLQKETASLHRKMYGLALDAARQAQHAFNLERGHTTRYFLPDCAWDDLRKGLLAGERLGLALRHMEKAYLDENVREYELTKHFSIRLHFPTAFLRLRATGCCYIDIPEWMFDVDYPGHFMRRIRNLTLTIPCVTGPFTGVHCRLTLLASITRIDPRRSAPAHECCCPEPCCEECAEDIRIAREYLPCPDDPRIVRQYGAREAIATSGSRDDSGLFQLDFNDQRYLPFEYMGAVSRWRIELPPENNYFDLDSLTDLVIRLGYTSREGGESLRAAAFAAARHHLPGDGWRFFDVRHEFPDAWQQLRGASHEVAQHACLRLRLERKMFPFVPNGQRIVLARTTILFRSNEDDGQDCLEFADCPCPQPPRRATRIIECSVGDERPGDRHEIACRASDEWPGFYLGMLETDAMLGQRDDYAKVEVRFRVGSNAIEQVFMLCSYTTSTSCQADAARRLSTGQGSG